MQAMFIFNVWDDFTLGNCYECALGRVDAEGNVDMMCGVDWSMDCPLMLRKDPWR